MIGSRQTEARGRASAFARLLVFVVAAFATIARTEEGNELRPEAQFRYWFDDHRPRAINMASSPTVIA